MASFRSAHRQRWPKLRQPACRVKIHPSGCYRHDGRQRLARSCVGEARKLCFCNGPLEVNPFFAPYPLPGSCFCPGQRRAATLSSG